MSRITQQRPHQPTRRQWLVKAARGIGASACVSGIGLAHAHTPYNQWRVYREKHLLIGCHRKDLATYELAQQLVATIQAHLPAAKARVARAPHPERLASLLGTDQLQFAVLQTQQASEMMKGLGRFKPYGKIAMSVVRTLDNYVLLARDDVSARHTWLVADALSEDDFGTAKPVIEISGDLTLHEGASAYFNNLPLPE